MYLKNEKKNTTLTESAAKWFESDSKMIWSSKLSFSIYLWIIQAYMGNTNAKHFKAFLKNYSFTDIQSAAALIW